VRQVQGDRFRETGSGRQVQGDTFRETGSGRVFQRDGFRRKLKEVEVEGLVEIIRNNKGCSKLFKYFEYTLKR